VLNLHDDPWVPDRVSLSSVDAAWSDLCESNPRYFDGSILHVLGVVRNGHGGVTIHAARSSYRFYAVQVTGLDTGTRALGVKGLCRNGSEWLMGRRSAEVAFYPGAWEFVPGGSVPAGSDPAEVLLRELREESGWVPTGPARAVAVIYDPGAFSWEIVSTLAVSPSTEAATAPWEYDELSTFGPGSEPEPLAPVARDMIRLRDGLTDDQ